jgi:hypothetical protein
MTNAVCFEPQFLVSRWLESVQCLLHKQHLLLAGFVVKDRRLLRMNSAVSKQLTHKFECSRYVNMTIHAKWTVRTSETLFQQ